MQTESAPQHRFSDCKKLLINIRDRQYADRPSGEDGLLSALRNISQRIQPNGKICVVEYDKNFELEKYFKKSKLEILKRSQIKRKEIRSKGRTDVISTFTLYLCQ
jgi:hypothetical protein